MINKDTIKVFLSVYTLEELIKEKLSLNINFIEII